MEVRTDRTDEISPFTITVKGDLAKEHPAFVKECFIPVKKLRDERIRDLGEGPRYVTLISRKVMKPYGEHPEAEFGPVTILDFTISIVYTERLRVLENIIRISNLPERLKEAEEVLSFNSAVAHSKLKREALRICVSHLFPDFCTASDHAMEYRKKVLESLLSNENVAREDLCKIVANELRSMLTSEYMALLSFHKDPSFVVDRVMQTTVDNLLEKYGDHPMAQTAKCESNN